MRKLYNEVSERIAKLDFGAIFEGFHPYEFALYDDANIYFADRTVEQEGFYSIGEI